MTSELDARRAQHEARLRAVLRYIDQHLDEPLSLEQLSGLVRVSRFHFHRLFSAIYGITVARYVQLARVERAANRLAFREDEPVLHVALAHGYDSSEAFARAFKKVIGQSPTQFRASPDWSAWRSALAMFDAVHRSAAERETYLMSELSSRSVSIERVEPVRVALLVHRGAPETVGDSIRKLISYRKERGLSPASSATFNVLYDDPSAVSPEEYRFGLAVSVRGAVEPNAQGLVESELPGGRVAKLAHTGDDRSLFAAVQWLYAAWLPSSGESLRDFPLYLQRVRFGPAVADHEAESVVFLPLEG